MSQQPVPDTSSIRVRQPAVGVYAKFSVRHQSSQSDKRPSHARILRSTYSKKRQQNSVYAALTSSVTQRCNTPLRELPSRMNAQLINRTTMGFQCGPPAANQNAQHPAKAGYHGQGEITQPGERNYLCKCDLAGYEMENCGRPGGGFGV